MTEDEFLNLVYTENAEKDFEEWIEHMEQSYADGEFSSFCK